MSTHVIPREIPRPSELGRPVQPGDNGELMGHLAEIAALCSRLQSSVGAVAEPRAVFEAALPVLRRLVDFRAAALFTVAEGGIEFTLAGAEPRSECEALERELRLQVEEGTFTWALYRNHPVLVPMLGRRGRVLMHSLSTSGGVRGMFFGTLPPGSTFIPEVTRELISIVLFTCAGVLESSHLNRRLTSYSEELEATVRTRTRALRNSEKEAREANRIKSEFLAHTSHEIRAPINGIIGTLSLLERTPLAADQRAFVDTVSESARVLVRLAGDVLDLSRIEAGCMEVERGPMVLRDVVDGAVELVAARAAERGLDLWVEWDRRLPLRTMGDAARVRQIVTNLLDNAVKFTRRGEVAVHCRLVEAGSEGSVRIEVCDTGPGIAPEDRERIFRRFAQGGTRGTRGEKGSGLGLAIARDLARIMGGDLVLEPATGGGSTFTLTLPTVAVDGAAATPGEGAEAVMLVTRDARVAEVVTQDLGWLGAEVATLGSLADAGVYLSGVDAPPLLLVDVDSVVGPADIETIAGTRRVALLGGPDTAAEVDGIPVLRRPWLSRQLRSCLGWSPREAGDAALQEGPAASSRLDGLRVLVVDDDAVTRTVLGWILKELGCRHTAVCDGQAALDHLEGEAVDVVLMDSRLPDLSGEETTRRILARAPRQGNRPIRVIGVSGRAGAEARAEMLAAGMQDVLVKPVTLEDIARVLPPSGVAQEEIPMDRLQAAGAEVLAEVWPERRSSLRTAATAGNPTTVAEEAHRMKGAGALVGAHEVADVAAALEMAARTGNTARIRHLLDELDQVMSQLFGESTP